MRILTRRQGQRNWDVLESTVYRAEAQLQQLLAESPSLIPVGEIRGDASELISAVRELGLPGSGSTDIVAFSAQGDIALVECKLANNLEIKRFLSPHYSERPGLRLSVRTLRLPHEPSATLRSPAIRRVGSPSQIG